jgi:hypothetical protein
VDLLADALKAILATGSKGLENPNPIMAFSPSEADETGLCAPSDRPPNAALRSPTARSTKVPLNVTFV